MGAVPSPCSQTPLSHRTFSTFHLGSYKLGNKMVPFRALEAADKRFKAEVTFFFLPLGKVLSVGLILTAFFLVNAGMSNYRLPTVRNLAL